MLFRIITTVLEWGTGRTTRTTRCITTVGLAIADSIHLVTILMVSTHTVTIPTVHTIRTGDTITIHTGMEWVDKVGVDMAMVMVGTATVGTTQVVVGAAQRVTEKQRV